MPSPLTRRLVRLPLRLLAALLATIAAAVAVWYGGLSVLTWLGVANPARGDTGTALGLGAATIGSSVVPTWMTARYYFESKDRLSRSSERTAGTDDGTADTGDDRTEATANAASDDDPDTGSETAPTVEPVESIDGEPTGRGVTTVEEELTAAAESLPLVPDLSDSMGSRKQDLQTIVRRMFGRRDR